MIRALLVIFVAMLLLVGGLLVLLVLVGRVPDAFERKLLLGATVAGFGAALALTNLSVIARPRLRPLAGLALVVTAAATYLGLRWAWGDVTGRAAGGIPGTAAVLAFGLGLATGILQLSLLGTFVYIRQVTLLAILATTGLSIHAIWKTAMWSTALQRGYALAAITMGVGLILVLVGRAVARKTRNRDAAPSRVRRCPHCGEALPAELSEVFN